MTVPPSEDYYAAKFDQHKPTFTHENPRALTITWPRETPALRAWVWYHYGAVCTCRETLRDIPQDNADVLAVLEYGAQKYAVGSWRRVPDAVLRYFNALLRHDLADTLHPGSLDEESGLSHAAHRACNAVFLRELLT